MSGNMSRNKGQRAEREVIALLQPVVNEVYQAKGMTPPDLQRNLLQSHKGGHDIHGLDWLAVEVKFHETLAVPGWWRQTLDQAERANAIPVLFYRQSRKPWTVRMNGYLDIEAGRRIKTPVDTSAAVFLLWFGEKLKARLG